MSTYQDRGRGVSSNRLTWEVIAFMALYLVAPGYCAFELSDKLPLITLSRGVLIVMGILLIIRRRNDLFNVRDLNIQHLNFLLTEDKSLKIGLLAYFVLIGICDVVFLLDYSIAEGIKALFVLVAEGYVLVWLLTLVLDTRKKLLTALQILVVTSGVVAIIVSVGCVYEVHPFHWLSTIQREWPQNEELRLGIIRAKAGFDHPVYYGAFCATISPVNMYFVEHSEKKWKKRMFSVCLALNIVALLLSNSRGSMLAFGCMVLITAVRFIRQKEIKKFIQIYVSIGLLALVILVLICLLTPVGLYFIQGLVNSILNIFLPSDFSLDIVSTNQEIVDIVSTNQEIVDIVSNNQGIVETVEKPEVLMEYGNNHLGVQSRTLQFSGIIWTLKHKPLFGFGVNSYLRGQVYYFMESEWVDTGTVDVGIVAIICQYGLVGLVAYVMLFGGMIKAFLSRKYSYDPLMCFLGLSFITYLLCLLSVSSVEKLFWIMTAIMVCFVNIIRKENGYID